MSRFTFCIGMLILNATIALPVIAAEPEVIVETDREVIFVGESFIYQVTLNHIENPSEPDLSSFKNVKIEKLGEQSLNSSSITIINGVRKVEQRIGRVYQYRLTPAESGDLKIPGPVATIDGKQLKGRAISIQVIPPQEQDAILLETSIDKTSVYPMQPFTVTLTASVINLPKGAADTDPLSVLTTPPKLQIPWYDDESLSGFEPEQSWRSLLQPISTRDGGFSINGIGDDSINSMFRRRSVGFRPQPKRATRINADGEELDCWVYTFSRTFIPKTIGEFPFGPATAKGTFVTGVQGRGLKGDRIFAAAEPVIVTVKDVPLDGRPDNWMGTIGQFDLEASLTPSTASVGDPLTLRLSLRGRGTFENMSAPDLNAIPEIAENFKIYEATQDTKSDGSGRTFIYSLRPTKVELTEFPAIEVPCFDVDKEEYVSLKTEPISVTFREAEKLSSSDIVAGTVNGNSDPRFPIASEDGIFGNDSNVVTLRNEAVNPSRWVMAWAGLLGFGRPSYVRTGLHARKWYKVHNMSYR